MYFLFYAMDNFQSYEISQNANDYLQLLSTFSQVFWETDNNGAIKKDSPSWRAVTGQTLEQWLNTGWVGAVHPEDQDSAVNLWHQAVQNQTNFDAELRLQSIEGSWCWTSLRAVAIRNADGTVQKWVGININVSQHKRDQEALIESELRFRAFVTATSDVVYRMSADWKQMHQLVGKQFLLDTGTTTSSWLDVYIPTQDRDLVQTAIEDAIADKKPFELEHRVIRVDGKLGWTFSRAIPILNSNQEIIEWFGSASDITEYKKVQQARRESEEQYRTLFESIDEGFCIVQVLFDSDGNAADYLFQQTNPAFIRQTGLENAVGKTMLELAPEHEPFWIQTYGQIATTGVSARFEHKAAALGYFYDVYAFPIGPTGLNQVAILFNDIFTRKKNEETQRDSEALKAFLLELSDKLRPLCDPVEIQQTAAIMLGVHLEADQVYYGEMVGDYMTIHPGFEHKLPSVAGRFHIQDLGSLLTAKFLTGQVQVVKDVPHDYLLDKKSIFLNAGQTGAYIRIPIIKKEVLVAVFAIHSRRPRDWSHREVEVVKETAERTWAAVESARSEQSLAESEQNYRTLFESMQEGYCICQAIRDENGKMTDYRFLQINPAFEKLTGLTNLQTLGKTVGELIPAIEKKWFAIFQNVIDSGNTVRHEDFISPLNHWYSITAFYYGSDQFAVLFDEISERKNHETSLAFLASISQDLEKLTNIDTAMTNIGNKIGHHFGLSYCAFVEIDHQAEFGTIQLGWCREDVPKISGTYRISDFIKPEFVKLSGEGEIVVINDICTDPLTESDNFSAMKIASLASVPLLRDNNWKFSLVACRHEAYTWQPQQIELLREVTARIWTKLERTRAEEALQASEARLAVIFKSLPVAVSEVDTTGRIVIANQAMERFIPSQEKLSNDRWEAYQPDGNLLPLKDYPGARALRGETAYPPLEMRFTQEDGSTIWTHVTAIPILNSQHLVKGYIFIVADINNLKMAESALQQADQRKDEFLAMLAHELRNPMSTVRNGLSVLSLSTPESNPLIYQTLSSMNRQVDHLVRLVDDLLDVSRITQNKIEFKKECIELGSLVLTAVNSVQQQFKAAGKQLHISAPSSPVFVFGDTTRLSQVVTNLLTNGYRYSGDQGHVWVNLSTEDDRALIRVKDNGIGLSNEQLTSIFELFVQADNSLARSQGGLGIGLTLVKRLVSMHEGHVEARSDGLGHGSEFLIYLPLTEPPLDQVIPIKSRIIAKQRGERILVIDDNLDATILVSLLLKLKGFDVDSRKSGLEGMKAAEESMPAVILCDIGMPGLNGYDTAKLIRQQPWGKTVPMIALTGYGQQKDKQLAMEAGFNGHLIKPVDIEELIQLLDGLLQ